MSEAPDEGEVGVAACSDTIDNDGDSFVDCNDWSCCEPETYELCATGSCRDSCPPIGARPVRVISGVIEDALWTCSELYVLDGSVSVVGTLRITPGTTVQAMRGSGLVVTRGGRIDAVGERARPIVFTSDASPRQPGDWQGLAMFGDARTHADASINFGGDDPTYDCGRLSYVRVEFAGGAQPIRDAGVLLAACGTATTIDHVQVHRSAGAGFLVLGGTAVLRKSISTLAAEGGLAFDLGWQGGAQQFAVLAGNSGLGVAGSNGGEEEPRSSPTLFNIALHGPGATVGTLSVPGAVFLEGARGRIRSSVVGEFDGPCVVVAADAAAAVTSQDLAVTHSVIHDCGSGSVHYSEPPFAQTAWDASNVHTAAFPILDPLDPDWVPIEGSPAATTTPFSPVPMVYTALPFVGAFSPDRGVDWSRDWTAYPQE